MRTRSRIRPQFGVCDGLTDPVLFFFFFFCFFVFVLFFALRLISIFKKRDGDVTYPVDLLLQRPHCFPENQLQGQMIVYFLFNVFGDYTRGPPVLVYFALGIGEMWIHSRVPEVMLHLEGRTTYGRNPCEEVGIIHPASGDEDSWNMSAGQEEGKNGDKYLVLDCCYAQFRTSNDDLVR
jgi:hypothetical protein